MRFLFCILILFLGCSQKNNRFENERIINCDSEMSFRGIISDNQLFYLKEIIYQLNNKIIQSQVDTSKYEISPTAYMYMSDIRNGDSSLLAIKFRLVDRQSGNCIEFLDTVRNGVSAVEYSVTDNYISRIFINNICCGFYLDSTENILLRYNSEI